MTRSTTPSATFCPTAAPSRLYRSLVRDQQIAADAGGESGFPGDKYPGLFIFGVVPLPGHTPDQMRTALHKENREVEDSRRNRR